MTQTEQVIHDNHCACGEIILIDTKSGKHICMGSHTTYPKGSAPENLLDAVVHTRARCRTTRQVLYGSWSAAA